MFKQNMKNKETFSEDAWMTIFDVVGKSEHALEGLEKHIDGVANSGNERVKLAFIAACSNAFSCSRGNRFLFLDSVDKKRRGRDKTASLCFMVHDKLILNEAELFVSRTRISCR